MMQWQHDALLPVAYFTKEDDPWKFAGGLTEPGLMSLVKCSTDLWMLCLPHTWSGVVVTSIWKLSCLWLKGIVLQHLFFFHHNKNNLFILVCKVILIQGSQTEPSVDIFVKGPGSSSCGFLWAQANFGGRAFKIHLLFPLSMRADVT